MVSVHEGIAISLATEFRAFCSKQYDDWYRWEWSDKTVRVRLENGMISIFSVDPMVAVEILGHSVLIVECDLAHPRLVDILREKLAI